MINISFYNSVDPSNTINKTLTDIITLQGELKEPTSILNPTIRIKRNDNILTANYLYIDKFSRYYFIDNIEVDGAFFVITSSVDALESFKAEILSSKQIIARHESQFNLYIEDTELPLTNNPVRVVKKIGTSPFNVDYNSVSIDDYIFTLTTNNAQATITGG